MGKMKIGIVMALFLVIVATGCGASWQKPMTKEEMTRYRTVVDFSKERYTNFRASMGLSKWQQSETEGRYRAGFIIASNPTSYTSSLMAFINDMDGYCASRAGVFKDVRPENNSRMAELQKKYSYQEENSSFECGPAGKGTISKDWTKFNPDVCRKLQETKVDMNKVKVDYGKPADFQCRQNDGVIFMGTIGTESYKSSIGPGKNLVIRLNEAKSGTISTSSERIDME